MKSQVGHNGNKEDELVKQKRKLSFLQSNLSRKGVKAGPTTPVHPWRIIDNEAARDNSYFNFVKLHATPYASSPVVAQRNNPSSFLSARKLAAAVWEFEFFAPLGGKMHRGGSMSHGQVRMRGGQGKDKVVEEGHGYDVDQPETASSLKRHIAAALMQQHRSVDKHSRSKQPISPSSYSSSMEMTRYNPIIAPSPTSSLEFKGRMGESSYSLKTSTELLKVLNRIWSLEEQHASSVSLIKGLKKELHNAHAKIKELVHDQQADRREINELMKQISEDKFIRKSKEQDRVSSAFQSTRDDLENERQLRKRSESLHKKLAREMVEVKTSFAAATEELEREKTSRLLLEGLCDEFAEGIKGYELEVQSLRQSIPEKEKVNGADRDRLILHVSEAWADERMHMKIRETQTGCREKYSVVDKLRPEVEKFLQSRHSRLSGVKGNKLNRNSRESRLRRNSMESVPMNDVVSGPQNTADEDSVDSDTHCFEINKTGNDSNQTEGVRADEGNSSTGNTNQKPFSREHIKSLNPTGLQVKFEEQMSHALSNDGNVYQTRDAESRSENVDNLKSGGMRNSQNIEICDAVEDRSYTNHSHGNFASSNYTMEHIIRNQHLMSEGGSMHLQKDPGETSSSYRKRASPVRQWMSKLVSSGPNTAESSSKNVPVTKDNTLKAKLLEARMKGQRPRSRIPLGL